MISKNQILDYIDNSNLKSLYKCDNHYFSHNNYEYFSNYISIY